MTVATGALNIINTGASASGTGATLANDTGATVAFDTGATLAHDTGATLANDTGASAASYNTGVNETLDTGASDIADTEVSIPPDSGVNARTSEAPLLGVSVTPQSGVRSLAPTLSSPAKDPSPTQTKDLPSAPIPEKLPPSSTPAQNHPLLFSDAQSTPVKGTLSTPAKGPPSTPAGEGPVPSEHPQAALQSPKPPTRR